MPKFSLLTASFLTVLALPAAAQDIEIHDAYIRAAGPTARTAAAFMQITNTGAQDDRLIAASSDLAARVELHTHIETDEGVMQMREVEDGFEIAAGGEHLLKRGADHVMFMGLTRSVADGDMVEVTLTFENSGDQIVEIMVDSAREDSMDMQHSN